jgi:hypothetical protein
MTWLLGYPAGNRDRAQVVCRILKALGYCLLRQATSRPRYADG